MLVPQLLMLYHQRYNAQTLRVHVERLRREGFVWWGRFYGGEDRFDAQAARTRWSHVAALADERSKKKEPSVLFVTNHVELHALEVSAMAFGDDPRGGVRREALPYYAGRSIPLWFRVVDVRALSYDHAMTLDWFDSRLGRVKAGVTRGSGGAYTGNFDPAASVLHQFPIVVDGPTCAELFDAEGRPASGKWADAPDAVTSRPVQRARVHLKKSLMPGLWDRLEEESRDLLANAWVERGRIEHDDDIDPAMGFTRMACAVEREMTCGLVPALERLRDRLKDAGPARAAGYAMLAERLAEGQPRDSLGKPGPWTMKDCLKMLGEMVGRNRREMERLGVPALVKLGVERRWLEKIWEMRNPASHGGRVVKRAVLRRELGEFFEERGAGMVGVVEARVGVEGCKSRGGPRGDCKRERV